MPQGLSRQKSIISELQPQGDSTAENIIFRYIATPRRYTRDELLSMRMQGIIEGKMAERLRMFTRTSPEEARPAGQSKEAQGAGRWNMGEFRHQSPIPNLPNISLFKSRKRFSTGSTEVSQQGAFDVIIPVPTSREPVQTGNRRKRAESLGRSWITPEAEKRGVRQENIEPAVLVPASSQADSALLACATSQESDKIEGSTDALCWRANASPPQGEPQLPWSDVAGSYQPGQIVWVPSHKDMSKDSVLHGHEDFGLNLVADPAGLTYHQAYAHPALVLKEDGTDNSRFVCLKITSWTNWSFIPGGKWNKNAPGACHRQQYYVPLFITDEILSDMPALMFRDGKNMPKREEEVENRSHVNVERVFYIEKAELRDFRIGCERHELVLTPDSIMKIEQYRNWIGRNEYEDSLTLARQEQGHQKWLRRATPVDLKPVDPNPIDTNPVGPDPAGPDPVDQQPATPIPPAQPNRVSWQKKGKWKTRSTSKKTVMRDAVEDIVLPLKREGRR